MYEGSPELLNATVIIIREDNMHNNNNNYVLYHQFKSQAFGGPMS